LQLAELDYLMGSTAARTSVAENYVGLPFEAADRVRDGASLPVH
jgi:hypothetical protein